jgi:hypothetical protein
MECKPINCPILSLAMSPSDQAADRKARALELAERGFTQMDIAALLDVSQKTVSQYLDGIYTPGINQKPAKTRTNPKGAGRPKGSKPNPKPRHGPQPRRRTTEPVQEKSAATLVLDQGKTYAQAAAELRLKSVQTIKTAVAREEGRREILAEPPVAREDLSLTAQHKFDIAIKQEKARLAASFDQFVREDIRRRMDEILLPDLKQQIAEAKTLYDRRRALMDKATFNMIRRGLHPDSRRSISDEKLGAAFDAFMGLEKVLLDEKDSPTSWPDMPSTLAEWDKMRASRKPTKKPGSNPIRPR